MNWLISFKLTKNQVIAYNSRRGLWSRAIPKKWIGNRDGALKIQKKRQAEVDKAKKTLKKFTLKTTKKMRRLLKELGLRQGVNTSGAYDNQVQYLFEEKIDPSFIHARKVMYNKETIKEIGERYYATKMIEEELLK